VYRCAGYYLKLFSDWRKMFFVSLGASALGGYFFEECEYFSRMLQSETFLSFKLW
jgi:hypothetical protein